MAERVTGRPSLLERSDGDLAAGIAAGGRLDTGFLVLTLAACAIATFGLLENSPAVIIGAMIVAPLMGAIIAVAYGALAGDVAILCRGATALTAGALLSVVLSAALAKAVNLASLGSEVLGRAHPNVLDLGVALAAGAVGAFACLRPSTAGALAGTAIAVALMPPLCVVGIGLAHADPALARGAALLFLTNLLGIMLAAMIVFRLAGVGVLAGVALLTALGLTALTAIPLVYSFREFAREARVEAALAQALAKSPAGLRRATVVSTRVDWSSDPPLAVIVVRARSLPGAADVAELARIATRATGQRLEVAVDVAPIVRVTSGDGANAPGDASAASRPSRLR